MSRRWPVALLAAGAVTLLAALAWFLRPDPSVTSPREQAQEAGQKFAAALATDPGAALARLRALPPGAERGAALRSAAAAASAASAAAPAPAAATATSALASAASAASASAAAAASASAAASAAASCLPPGWRE